MSSEQVEEATLAITFRKRFAFNIGGVSCVSHALRLFEILCFYIYIMADTAPFPPIN